MTTTPDAAPEADGPMSAQKIRALALNAAVDLTPIPYPGDGADGAAADQALRTATQFAAYIATGDIVHDDVRALVQENRFRFDSTTPNFAALVKETLQARINAYTQTDTGAALPADSPIESSDRGHGGQPAPVSPDPYTLQAVMRRVSHLEAIVMPIPKLLSDTCDDCGAPTTGGVTGAGKPPRSWCGQHCPPDFVADAAAAMDVPSPVIQDLEELDAEVTWPEGHAPWEDADPAPVPVVTVGHGLLDASPERERDFASTPGLNTLRVAFIREEPLTPREMTEIEEAVRGPLEDVLMRLSRADAPAADLDGIS